ncbi:MAG TPA: ATPase, partial [Brevundimonas sp.]|nr:ATPase [Brevundimonas sp.]
MPYEVTSSPVAPPAGSRLWTAGASAGVAMAALVATAAFHPDTAPYLLAVAGAVGLGVWAVNRSPPTSRPHA